MEKSTTSQPAVAGPLRGSRRRPTCRRGGARSPDTDRLRYLYEYEIDGAVHAGRGYTTGWRWDEGQSVQIEVDAAAPAVSRLPGARRALFGAGAAFAGIFPLSGAVALGIALLLNGKKLSLLIHGRFASGRVVEKKPTSVTVNDRRVYRYAVEFRADAGSSHRFSTRTHRTERVEEAEALALLYDPSAPTRAVLFDTISNAPEPGPDGTFRAPHKAVLRGILLPGLCLLPHLAYAVWRFGI